ncbi:hypothetical protein [Paraclostridium sordellii]|uniref:hypothetical protein n=1 Tax=Paraclostridium sordellii TaxID=1505 RepID=UPI0005DF23E8|nr:hypothetical protein [Paeniclostridium sordellii]CEP39750.1 Uncharacterised protein [[Clostridium] sordellii] [Paeniclostridium sordellii]
MIDIDLLFTELNERLQIFLENPIDNMMLAHDIQMSLLNNIIEVENEIRAIKVKIKNNKKISRESIHSNDIRRKLGIESKEFKELIIYYKESIKRLCEIGDSIAFAYFSKSDLKNFCYKQSPGFISGKEGLQNEINTFKSIFESGKFAILNDLTNSLRYGDITIEENGLPKLLEVKSSSNKNNRIIRQEEDITQHMNIINNDYIENFLGTDNTFKRIYTKNKEINYQKELQDLIDKSIHNGRVAKEIEDGLIYIVDYKPSEFQSLEFIFKKINEPKLFYINSMKDLKENYTPFPMIIKNNEHLMEFYRGNLLITVVVDVSIIRKKLDKKGFTLKSNENNNFTITFQLKGEDTDIVVSSHYICRIGREFLSLNWFINEIENMIDSIKG